MSVANTDGEIASINVDEVVRHLNIQYNRLLLETKQSTDCKPAIVSKSSAVAIGFRNRGNEKFRDADDHEALSWYTKSVAYAEEGSEVLALAYANRSATLFRLCKYASCLHDINRALRGSYPQSLQKKLRTRKKQCLIEINRAKDTTAAQFNNRIEADATDPVQGIMPHSSQQETAWRDLISNFKNPLIPNASSKIKIECDDKWGRYLMATADIMPGEILSSQQFVSLVLEQELRYLNCSYCLAECSALIPCPSCSQLMYCSSLCRERAYNSYHRTECKFLSLKRISDFIDYDFMALRMLLIGTEQGTKLRNLMKRLTKRDIFRERDDPTNKPFVNDYTDVLKLCRTFQPSRVKCLTSNAVETIVILKSIGFFGNDSVHCLEDLASPQRTAVNLSETELFAALLFINHASAANSNMFAITPLTNSNLLCNSSEKVIGGGICTVHNFLNHSCDPDVRFIIRNREHVLLAIRPINKDQQIFFSYFNSFASNPIEERNRKLSSFGFSCHCNACCNLWPLETDIMKQNVKFLLDGTEAKAELMNLKPPIRPVAARDIMKLQNHEIFEVVCRLCKWLYVNIERPSVSILHAESLIYNFIRLWQDDFSKIYMNEESKKYVELTMRAIGNHVLGS